MPPERTTRRCLRTGRPKRVKIEPSVSSESSGEDIPFAPSSEASVRSEASATALDPDSDDNDGDNVSEATVLTSTRPGGISHQQKTIKKELWELLDSWLNKNPGEMPPCALRADYNPIPSEIPKSVIGTQIYWSAIHNVMFWCPASSHLPSYAGLCVCTGDQYGTGSVQILLSKLIKTTWFYQRCLEQFIDHGLAVFVRYVFIPEQKVHLSEPCVAIGLSWREGVFSHERHKNQVHNIRKQRINNAITGSISVVGQKIN